MELTEQYQALLVSIEEAQQEIRAGQQLLRLLQKIQAQAGRSPQTVATVQQTSSGWTLETPGRRVQLPPGGALLIGRQDGCDLRLEDKKASRQHARIERRGVEYWVVDLGSSNGVYLNEQRINSEARLVDGDQLLIGDTRLVVCAPRGEPSSERTLASSSKAPVTASEFERGAAASVGQAPGSERKCAQCGQSLSAAARFCPYCGAQQS